MLALVVAAGAVVALWAIRPTPGGSNARVADPLEAGGSGPGVEDLTGSRAAPINRCFDGVQWPGQVPGEDPWNALGCTFYYLRFAQLLDERGLARDSWSDEQLQRWWRDHARARSLGDAGEVQRIRQGHVRDFWNPEHGVPFTPAMGQELPLTDDAARSAYFDLLARGLTDAMNLGFLLDGLDERALAVWRLVDEARQLQGGVGYRRVQFEDPWVGLFDAVVLLPPELHGAGAAGEEPARAPAVIVHPGHRETADDHVFDRGSGEASGDVQTRRYARELALAGHVVLVINPRAYDGVPGAESVVARTLLARGQTLMSLRVYEVLLAARYLRWLRIVDDDRVAVMGHSGGSAVANLAVRLDDRFAGLVTDHSPDYMNTGLPDESTDFVPSDDFAPLLWPFSGAVGHFETLAIPVAACPYGYPDGGRLASELPGGVTFFDVLEGVLPVRAR